jgi:hypothetical protein
VTKSSSKTGVSGTRGEPYCYWIRQDELRTPEDWQQWKAQIDAINNAPDEDTKLPETELPKTEPHHSAMTKFTVPLQLQALARHNEDCPDLPTSLLPLAIMSWMMLPTQPGFDVKTWEQQVEQEDQELLWYRKQYGLRAYCDFYVGLLQLTDALLKASGR